MWLIICKIFLSILKHRIKVYKCQFEVRRREAFSSEHVCAPTCVCYDFALLKEPSWSLKLTEPLMTNKFKLLFFGSDIFSVRVLNSILINKTCPVQVVTKPKTILHQFSKNNNIIHYTWTPGIGAIDPRTFNIGLVASFGAMIDIATIEKFDHGLFNVHPSLLPVFRGSTPVQAAILAGIKETGCTVMKIPPVEKFDIGHIVLQEKLLVKRGEYARDLMVRLADLGGHMANRLLLEYDSVIENVKPQSEAERSYAKRLKPEMGLLSFKSESSVQIDRKVRAYTSYIGLYTYCLGGLRCNLKDMKDPQDVATYNLDRLAKMANHVDVVPGVMFFHKKRKTLCIKCSNGGWLAFDRISPMNKNSMSALEFHNGYLSKVEPQRHITDI